MGMDLGGAQDAVVPFVTPPASNPNPRIAYPVIHAPPPSMDPLCHMCAPLYYTVCCILRTLLAPAVEVAPHSPRAGACGECQGTRLDKHPPPPIPPPLFAVSAIPWSHLQKPNFDFPITLAHMPHPNPRARTPRPPALFSNRQRTGGFAPIPLHPFLFTCCLTISKHQLGA